jgi:hypothetical protein
MDHDLQTLHTVFLEWQYEHAMKENQWEEDKPLNLFWVIISRWGVCDKTIS